MRNIIKATIGFLILVWIVAPSFGADKVEKLYGITTGEVGDMKVTENGATAIRDFLAAGVKSGKATDADLTNGARKFDGRQFKIATDVVTEGRHQNSRKIVTGFGHRGAQTLDIVIFECQQMRTVLRRHAGDGRRTPGQRAMVAALCNQDLAASGAGPGNRHARGGGIAAIFLEHRPVRMRQHPDQILGKLDHDLAGSVQAIAARRLRRCGRLDLRMLVTE